MKIIVKMQWVEGKGQYHMLMPDDTFIQELYWCENLQKLFQGLNKEKSKLYTIEIESYGDANER